MSRQRYNSACRQMVAFTGGGMLLSGGLGVVAVNQHDWAILVVAGICFAINLMVCGIVVADGVRRFGDKELQ